MNVGGLGSPLKDEFPVVIDVTCHDRIDLVQRAAREEIEIGAHQACNDLQHELVIQPHFGKIFNDDMLGFDRRDFAVDQCFQGIRDVFSGI